MLQSIEVLQALPRCESPEQLRADVDALTHRLGIGHWIYALDLPVVQERREQFMLGGYPPAWVEHYFHHDYLRIDPVIAHCQSHTTPLIWSDALPRPRVADPRTQATWRLFAEAGEFGLRRGVTVPLHGPGASWGLVSFASDQLDDAQMREALPSLHLFAHFLHEAAHRFATTRALPRVPELTPRERECLHWAAAGKTSWEIGKLLRVSERTAVFHLQNASRKLGVSSRQAAVARAVALGLISP